MTFVRVERPKRRRFNGPTRKQRAAPARGLLPGDPEGARVLRRLLGFGERNRGKIDMSALADLDWYYTRGATLTGSAIPLERAPASTSRDDDGQSADAIRYATISRAIARVEAGPRGALHEWVLRAWHGGPHDAAPIDRAVEAYGAVLLGARGEDDERRILMAAANERACAEEVKRLQQIVTPQAPPAEESEDAPRKRKGRARRRRNKAAITQRASVTSAELDLRLAKRHLQEARDTTRTHRGSAAAGALRDARAAWGELGADQKRVLVVELHKEAVAAFVAARGKRAAT
ncbi:MAG: hypothetical protein IT374_26445 [Polyangiaceae bacterium]|nr:hypothetical protein [Polyangiaceae bacterium]